MKILYINGYKGSNSKVQVLEKIIGTNIDFELVDYDKDFNYDKIEERSKYYDIIIGSSTGAYVARNICEKYNIPLISINPVIDIKETFNKLNANIPNIPIPKFESLEELIILGNNDELIDYNKTKEKMQKQASF